MAWVCNRVLRGCAAISRNVSFLPSVYLISRGWNIFVARSFDHENKETIERLTIIREKIVRVYYFAVKQISTGDNIIVSILI